MDASIALDPINESEAQVNYKSFMKESLACETLDILGLLDCLLGSLEQSALTREKATLLRKWQMNKRRCKSAQTQAQDKNCESVEHVDDETVTVVAHDVGRQDSLCDAERIKFPRQRKKTHMFDLQELCSSWQDLSDEEQVESFMSKT